MLNYRNIYTNGMRNPRFLESKFVCSLYVVYKSVYMFYQDFLIIFMSIISQLPTT